MNKTKLGISLLSLALLAIALMPLAPSSAAAVQGNNVDAALGIFSDPMSFGIDCGGTYCMRATGACVDSNLNTHCAMFGAADGCGNMICSGEPGAPDQ